MKKIALLSLFGLFSTLLAAPSVPGVVNVSDFLNARLGPGLRHPIVGRLAGQSEVKVLRICGNWLELQIPETFPVYVSEARVNPDGKLNGELNLRCKTDVNSPSYGTLAAGASVQRLEERSNGWVRIVPPEHLKVYVAAVCVKFDRTAFDENGVLKAVPEAKKDAAAAPAPVSEPATKEEKKSETLTGMLIRWKYGQTPETGYALLDGPNGKNLGFIVAQDKGMIEKNLDKKVQITAVECGKTAAGGRILRAESIVPAAESAAPAAPAAAVPAAPENKTK